MSTVQLIQISVEELTEKITNQVTKKVELLLSESHGKPQASMEKAFLNRKETADFFGISLVCLHTWINQGKLKPYKVQGKTYFKYEELIQAFV